MNGPLFKPELTICWHCRRSTALRYRQLAVYKALIGAIFGPETERSGTSGRSLGPADVAIRHNPDEGYCRPISNRYT